MVISKAIFEEYFLGLCDRYNRKFESPITAKGYYTYLNDKLSDEEFATATMQWITDRDMFPTPAELLANWKGTQPPKNAPIETQGKLYHELNEEERQRADEARERIWAMLKNSKSQYVQSKAGFASIGSIASNMFQASSTPSAISTQSIFSESESNHFNQPTETKNGNYEFDALAVGEF